MDSDRFRSTADVVADEDELAHLFVQSVNVKIHTDAPKDGETIRKIERVKTAYNRGGLTS